MTEPNKAPTDPGKLHPADSDTPTTSESAPLSGRDAATGTLPFEAFDPAQVRAWRFHNRVGSGMDDPSLDALAASIERDGQQQLGLARRLPPGDTHSVEVIFGLRRLEACRRVGVPWRAEVREQPFSDAHCAALMHSENEWSEQVSPLENARQWKAMLDAGVFPNQSDLANDLGCHRARISRGVRAATTLLGEDWLARLVLPVMHEFTGRSAFRLADALENPASRQRARRRAADLEPGTVPAHFLYEALLGGDRAERRPRDTMFVRHQGPAGQGPVIARIERDGAGGFSVNVRPHEQTPAELAELAEKIEALLAAETATAAGVRLGRRLVASLSPEEVRDVDRSWLEGCIWASARASGLEWDRWRCMSVAETLRSQPDGWETAVVNAIGGPDADPAGFQEPAP